MIQETKKYPNGLSYDDVLLKPQYSDIRSRSEIDISSALGDKLKLKLPIIASPMDTVSETDMAIVTSRLGGTAIIHRYNTIPEQINLMKNAYKKTRIPPVFGAAVGISGGLSRKSLGTYQARRSYTVRGCSARPSYFNEGCMGKY